MCFLLLIGEPTQIRSNNPVSLLRLYAVPAIFTGRHKMEYLSLLAHDYARPWPFEFESWMILIAFVASLWSLIWCRINSNELKINSSELKKRGSAEDEIVVWLIDLEKQIKELQSRLGEQNNEM
jgi:hypothetical protein